MASKEAGGIFARESWDACVASHIGDEGLFCRPECVEQLEGHRSVIPLVVPLEEDVQRDRDLTRLLHRRSRYVAAGEKSGSYDARVDRSQTHSDRDHPAGESDSLADLRKGKYLIKRGLQLRHGVVDEWKYQPVDDIVRGLFPSRDRTGEVRSSLLSAGQRGSVACSRQLDGDRREPLQYCAARTCSESGIHPSHPEPAGLAHQEEWNLGGRGCRWWRPQDARDDTDGEFALDDALFVLFRSEVHGRAFRERY